MAKEKKPRSRGRRRFRKFLAAIEAVFMLCAVFGAYVWGKASQINTVELDETQVEINEEVKATTHMTGYTNVALFGVDTRTGELSGGTNADTMIVASINHNTEQINMCSLYRDTYIDVGSGTYAKANAAYSYGGPEGALSMLNRSMDLELTNYITVDFTALADTIDDLGGLDVEMTAEEAFWTNGYVTETSQVAGVDPVYLPNTDGGTYHLNGIQATSFCRIRYTAGDDFKRTERQRLVLSLIFEKAKTMDLATLNEIADDVFPKIQTNMSLSELLSIGASILTYSINQSMGMPINKTTGTITGVGSSVIATSWVADVSELHALFFGETGYVPSSAVQSLATQMQSPSGGTSNSYDNTEDTYYNYDEDTAGTYNSTDTYTEDTANTYGGESGTTQEEPTTQGGEDTGGSGTETETDTGGGTETAAPETNPESE